MLFKVGDFLASRAHMECRRLWPNSSWRPVLLQVVEVMTQTCPAGIEQVYYRCRGASPAGVINGEYTLFNEIELAPAPTEPAPVTTISALETFARLKEEVAGE